MNHTPPRKDGTGGCGLVSVAIEGNGSGRNGWVLMRGDRSGMFFGFVGWSEGRQKRGGGICEPFRDRMTPR
jgi:hypothetical protein